MNLLTSFTIPMLLLAAVRPAVADVPATPDAAAASALDYQLEVQVRGKDGLEVSGDVRLRAAIQAQTLAFRLAAQTKRLTVKLVEPRGGHELNPRCAASGECEVTLPTLVEPNTDLTLRFAYRVDKVLRKLDRRVWVAGPEDLWYPRFLPETTQPRFSLEVLTLFGTRLLGPDRLLGKERDGQQVRWKQEIRRGGAGGVLLIGSWTYVPSRDPRSGLVVGELQAPGAAHSLSSRDATPGAGGFAWADGGGRRGSSATGIQVPVSGGGEFTGAQSVSRPQAQGSSPPPRRLLAPEELSAAGGWLASVLGPLPLERLVVVRSAEARPASSLPSVVVLPASGNEDRFPRGAVSELARQWWGLGAPAASAEDDWLVEGLAELSAALCAEHLSGPEAGAAHWQRASAYVAASPLADLALPELARRAHAEAAAATPSAVVGDLLAAKAGLALEELRRALRGGPTGSDAAFEAILRAFFQRGREHGLRVDELRALAAAQWPAAPGMTASEAAAGFLARWPQAPAIALP